MESPDRVQTSLAAALTLGLERGRFARDIRLRGLNLLLNYEEGCAASCGYCGLARNREGNGIDRTFIRVKWPVYRVDDLIVRVNRGGHALERVCISMVAHPRGLADTLALVRRFKGETNLLISVLLDPTAIKGNTELDVLRNAGADRVAVAVDAATEEIFATHRGRRGRFSWDHYWRTLRDSVGVFGHGRAGIHLVVGLGETEEEMIGTIQEADNLGAPTHLFSFFPEAGTRLENRAQPPIGQYRRVQLARYIINEGLGSISRMRFDGDGRVTDFGVDLEPLLALGDAFTTSGCAGRGKRTACNRPFGNERPSEPFRNFPMPPEPEDIALIKSQLWSTVDT